MFSLKFNFNREKETWNFWGLTARAILLCRELEEERADWSVMGKLRRRRRRSHLEVLVKRFESAREQVKYFFFEIGETMNFLRGRFGKKDNSLLCRNVLEWKNCLFFSFITRGKRKTNFRYGGRQSVSHGITVVRENGKRRRKEYRSN